MRLDRSDPMTCDQDHGYTAEQLRSRPRRRGPLPAEHRQQRDARPVPGGLRCSTARPEPVPAGASSNDAVMDYYDGNTVTGLWNYAQHFAMSDNAFGTTYGPSTPGALNVTSAQTYGAICGPTSATINDSTCAAPPGYNATNVLASTLTTSPSASDPTVARCDQPAAGAGTTYSDADPYFDLCSYAAGSGRRRREDPARDARDGRQQHRRGAHDRGTHLGLVRGRLRRRLRARHTATPPTTAQICSESHKNVGGSSVVDYIPHHDPFQYYASTANPMHLPPTSVAMIGHNDQANHQYDIADFWAAADSGNLPAVSYLKAPAYQDGHAGYSDPLDEQTWLADTINHLETLPTWSSTAVVDHLGRLRRLVRPRARPGRERLADVPRRAHRHRSLRLASIVSKTSAGTPEQGKCGVGPRLPFLVISPYARAELRRQHLDRSELGGALHRDNWNLPALGNGAADSEPPARSTVDVRLLRTHRPRALFLDPATGEPVGHWFAPSGGRPPHGRVSR